VILLGSPRYLGEEGVDIARLEGVNGTILAVARGGHLRGHLLVSDSARESAADAVGALHELGVRTAMLTGDREESAQLVASATGVELVAAGLLPEEKLQRLRAMTPPVGMVGDGINDAPALAAADVGIAMGAGADVAVASAGNTLSQRALTGLLRARKLAQATMRNIRQNLFFAFIYNSLGVPVAAGLLYPFFGLLLSPMIAAAAMSLSSVSVISNALRLRRAKI